MDALQCRDHCDIDCVFEGGGIRGIALIGAAAALESAGYVFRSLVGTSAGALVAAFLAAGYKAEELAELARELNYLKLIDPGPRWLPRPVAATWGVARHWGAYRGDKLLAWLQEMLAAKGVRTFADLPEGKLRVVASDVSRGRMVTFPDEAHYYGLDLSTFEVALAVRASTAIPLVFRPVVLRCKAEPVYLVDGGLTSNMPMALCDGPGYDERPTFGVLLKDYDPWKIRYRPRNLGGYLVAQFATARLASDARYLQGHDYLRTIAVDASFMPVTQFQLPRTDRVRLECLGRDAVLNFLRHWDFTEWQAVYAAWNRAAARTRGGLNGAAGSGIKQLPSGPQL